MIRLLQYTDYHKGFVETLSSLRATTLSYEQFLFCFGRLTANTRVWVAEEISPYGSPVPPKYYPTQIVATGTLLLEHKFIHNGGIVGHIEDVAVREDQKGKGFGRAIVWRLVEDARDHGCYKVILDCEEENVAFYEKLGFRKHEQGMRLDLIQSG